MRVDWQKTASVLFCVLVAAGGVFLVGKYLLVILMPFLIAWGLAMLIHPAAKGLAARVGLPRKAVSAVLVILVFAVVGTLLFLGVSRLIDELGRLVERISAGEIDVDGPLSRMMDGVGDIGSRIPFLSEVGEGRLRESLDGMLDALIREAGSKLASLLTALVTGLVRALPSIAIFVIVTVIAAFYFALDLDTIHGFLVSLFPERISKKLPALRDRVRRFFVKYLRAYLLLMLLTFLELFVGFSLLSVEYSFLLALAISLVDVLPVLGVGTVLVPWSVAELFMRDFRTGFGLLILWAVITVLRQVAEPRLVGGSLGLHPVVTLVGMYVGFRLFGILGMLFAPALTVAAKVILKEWQPNARFS